MVVETLGRHTMTGHLLLMLSSMLPLYLSKCNIYLRYNSNIGDCDYSCVLVTWYNRKLSYVFILHCLLIQCHTCLQKQSPKARSE